MPILGTIASSRLVAPQGVQAFESIQTVTVASGTSTSLTFSSIPSWAKHLRIMGTPLSNYTNTGTGESGWAIYLNGDSGSGAWVGHQIQGNGATTSRGWSGASLNAFILCSMPWYNTNSLGSAIRNPVVIDFFDAKNTTKAKALRYFAGFSNRTTGTNQRSYTATGAWNSTSAITSITLDATSTYADGPFATYTTFTLYGMRDQ